jgi:hypothetical protein
MGFFVALLLRMTSKNRVSGWKIVKRFKEKIPPTVDLAILDQDSVAG